MPGFSRFRAPLLLPGATSATRYAGGTASGAPTTGTFAVGDFVVDQTGIVWVCTAAGTPGTWVATSPATGASGAVLFSSQGTTGSENDALDVWTPGYYGLKAWNGDPMFANLTGQASATQTCWAFRIFCPGAFPLTKIAYLIQTANSVPTAANSTTVAAGSNTVDVTTFAGAGVLNVASIGASPATGTLLVQTSAGQVWISYTGTAAGQYTGCTTLQGGTGTLSTGGTVVQSLNTLGVYNNAGTSMLGILGDQGINWGSTGMNGAFLAPQTLTTPVGTSAAVAAGTYLWVVYLATGTTAPVFRTFHNNTVHPNLNLAVASLRVARVAAVQTSFPATINPAAFTSSNVSSPGVPFFALQ